MKVEYLTLSGARSTAYLDMQLTSMPTWSVGADKYTDETVAVRFEGSMWVQQNFTTTGE